MPKPNRGWLYLKDEAGAPREIFNHARTAAYLKNPALALNGVSICDVLEFGGCRGYAFEPPCGDNEPAYVQFPGTASNGLQAPDAAALDIVGDITLIADVSMADWTPGTARTIMGKWSTASQLSYAMAIDAFGTPEIRWTTNGSTVQTVTADANLGGLGGNTRHAIRIDFDVNVGGSLKVVYFFHAPTWAGPWVALGSARGSATATTIHSGTSTLQLGYASQLANPMVGKMYRAQIRNGMSGVAGSLGGSSVFDFNPEVISDPNATTILAATGQTITVQRSGSPATTLNPGETFWEEYFYTTPALDNAPWYNVNYPESADALGFFIEEWTGLDSEHISRSVAPRHRGGQLGPVGAAHRVMKMNIIAFARNEKALDYLYRWLDATLSSVCSGCSTDSILVRRWCPTDLQNLWDGVVEIRRVGLIEGLTWGGPLGESSACSIRRLSFTLAAGDSCMYTNTSTPQIVGSTNGNMTTCLSGVPLAEGKTVCRPRCIDTLTSCRSTISFNANGLVTAPIVTLTNANDAPIPPLRVICYGDPGEVGLLPNPCGLPILGEVYTRIIPAWSELIWDVVGRTMRFVDPTTGGLVSGFAYIDANDPPIERFFTLPCGRFHIVVEPATWCMEVDVTNNRYVYQSVAFPWATLHFPTVALEIGERLGCA